MAKKNRSRKNRVTNTAHQHRLIWQDGVVIELLAFLDYGALCKMKPAQINEEAARHLNKKYGNHAFSFPKVKSKFRWLWNTYGPNDDVSGNYEGIYEEGSKNLSWPTAEQRVEITHRFEEICKEKLKEFVTSPRKTRSVSQALNSTASPDRFRSASTSSLVVFNSSKTTQVASVHPLRQQISSLSDYAETDPNAVCSLQQQETSVKTEQVDTICETPQPSSFSCSDNPQSSSVETFRTTNPSAPAPLPVVLVSQEVNLATETECETSLESMARRLLEADIKYEQMERKRALEVDFWRARCISAETERAEAKKLHLALSVKFGELIQRNQKLDMRDVASYEARILALVEKVDGLHRSERLAVSDAPDLPNDMSLAIAKSMERIDVRLQKLFEGQEFDSCPSTINAPENRQLQCLFAKVLNIDLADATMPNVLEFSSERISRSTLLRALCAAALAEWVFHGASKDVLFDRYDGDSIRGLTSRYARALKNIESRDPKFARNMDLNIHREVISEPSFKEFLKLKAADLAGRLQDALAPLWSRLEEADDGYDDGYGTARSDSIELTEVFYMALEIQCRLAVTSHNYVCIWHAPGTWFDSKIMNTESAISGLDSGAGVVEVTLLPGISQLPRDYPGGGQGSFLDSGCVAQGAGGCLAPVTVSLSSIASA